VVVLNLDFDCVTLHKLFDDLCFVALRNDGCDHLRIDEFTLFRRRFKRFNIRNDALEIRQRKCIGRTAQGQEELALWKEAHAAHELVRCRCRHLKHADEVE
jgi:hypothetical protein